MNKPAQTTLAKSVAAIAAGLLTASQAHAFHLGEMKVSSRVGEPLRATVDLWTDGSETNAAVQARVLPDILLAGNRGLTESLAGLTARYVDTGVGAGYIEINGTTPFMEPILALRLRVEHGDAARLRNYSAALSRPLPPTRLANQSGRTRQARPTNPIEGDTYVVKSGDTLWRIANRVGGNAQEVMDAIVGMNPHAFVNGDANRLKAGVTLDLPGATATAATEVTQVATANIVPTEVAADNVVPTETATPEPIAVDVPQPATVYTFEAESANTADTTASTSTDTVQASPQIDTSSQANADAESGSVAQERTTAPVDWREIAPESAAQVDRLAEKFARIRAQYGFDTAGTSSVAAADPAPTPATAPEVDAPEVDPVVEAAVEVAPETVVATEPEPIVTAVAETAAVAAVDVAVVEETIAEPLAEPAAEPLVVEPEIEATPIAADEIPVPASVDSTETTTANASSFPQLPWGIIIPAAAVLLVTLLLGLLVPRVLKRFTKRRAEAQFQSTELDLKAEVARKAEHRVKLESEVRKLLNDRATGDAAPESGDSGDVFDVTGEFDAVADEAPQAPTDDSYEPPDLATTLDDLAPADTDIDTAIAHGRYDEAEAQLLRVIDDNPNNHEAKLRLAEVFYITERIEEFTELAQELHSKHREVMTDDEWRRVMRMGKIIAPDRPPFCGPREVPAKSREADA